MRPGFDRIEIRLFVIMALTDLSFRKVKIVLLLLFDPILATFWENHRIWKKIKDHFSHDY